MQLLLHLEAEWSGGVKMDCCSAGHNHAEANNPEIKNNTRNFLVPITFSKIIPNNAKANKLYIKCSRLPCKNILVINVHGLLKASFPINLKESVNPFNVICNMKTIKIIMHKIIVEYLKFSFSIKL